MAAPRPTLADVLALAAELTSVLEAIGQSVHSDFLTPSRSENGSLLQQKPIVFVELENLLDEQQTPHSAWDDREKENASTLSIGLSAIARIAMCSHHLTKHPKLKAAFWRKLVAPFFSESEITMISKWRLEDDQVPRIAFTFPSTAVEEPLMDEILTFMTTPPIEMTVVEGKHGEFAEQFMMQAMPARKLAFGMWFVNYELQLECLELIRTLLDHAFKHPGRLYGIDELYLSINEMDPPVLRLLCDIVTTHRCIPEILIHESSATKAKDLSSDETQSLRSLIAAALNQDSRSVPPSSQLQSATKEEDSAASSLQHFSFHSSFGVNHYAAVCSALRYGCTPGTVAFSSYLNGDANLQVRKQCWRWLAFGLFYPRSKRFENACHLQTVDLTGTYMQPEDIEAFQNTLQNPAAELLYDGDTTRVSSGCSALVQVCSVKKGAAIFEKPQENSKLVVTMEEQSEMETLCEEGAWTCIVVPAFGLGWVNTDEVAMTVEDPEPQISSSVAKSPKRRRLGLIMNDMDDSNTSPAALQAFIETIGSRLCSLELRCIARDRPDLLATVCTQCVNLQHLDLENWRLQRSEVDTLLDALSGDLGDRLLSLNLNNNDMGVDGFERFAAILSRSDRIPALQELRLFCHPIGVFGLVSCHGVLRANKTLRVLELDLPSRTTNMGRVLDTEFPLKCIERDRLDTAYQDELLCSIPVPFAQKLAFLSVLGSKCTKPSVRSAVDALVLSLVFKFAAQEVRRKICWSRIPT